jgi:hypothetical protein
MHGESNGPLNKIERSMKRFIMWIEILLAGFIIVTVLLSGKDIVVLIHKIYITEASQSYQLLQGLLAHILLLVVGLELALMLITHSAGNVLEVILYAIARKMLISSSNTMDILLGVIALAIIFIVDKYFHTKDINRSL